MLGEVTPNEWRHLLSAKAHGRVIGGRGRPRILSPNSEQNLIDEVRIQAQEDENPTAETVTQLVCINRLISSLLVFCDRRMSFPTLWSPKVTKSTHHPKRLATRFSHAILKFSR